MKKIIVFFMICILLTGCINNKISEDSEIRRFIEQNNLQNYDERDICQVLETTSNIEIIIS